RSRPVMIAAVSASISSAWSWAARARASVAPLSATVACAAARGRRGYRVALHEIAERLLQPRKPGLVVTPLIDAFGIERLADLLRADGLHDAGILVEAQAPRFERQATVVKEPAQFAFRIVDEALVMHAVHAPREDGIEVLHVADVVPVVAPEFLEVVAEIDAAAEELLVAGEAAAKWMSPRVNDRGTRKHQLDEAYMTEVAQHLIDEARLARGAIYLGPRQVARGETFDLPAPERGDGSGILRRFADIGARPQLQCERRDVGQFACALHLRMRRQNLFEQRRSGAWQADDKNWIRSLAAPFGTLGKENWGVDRLGALQLCGDSVRIVADGGAMQLVTAGIVLERGFELPFVLQRLAQGELEMNAVGASRRAARELLLHRRPVGGGEAEGLEVGEARVRGTRPGPHLESPPVHFDRPRLLTNLSQQVSIPHPAPVLARVVGNRLLHEGDGLVAAAEESQ